MTPTESCHLQRARGPDERQQPSQFWNGVQFAHHGIAQVVGPDPRVCVSHRPDCVSHAIGTCPSGHSELKWCTRGLDHLPKLAGQRFGDQPAKRGPRRDVPHSSILFLESCHRGKHESFWLTLGSVLWPYPGRPRTKAVTPLRRPNKLSTFRWVHPTGPRRCTSQSSVLFPQKKGSRNVIAKHSRNRPQKKFGQHFNKDITQVLATSTWSNYSYVPSSNTGGTPGRAGLRTATVGGFGTPAVRLCSTVIITQTASRNATRASTVHPKAKKCSCPLAGMWFPEAVLSHQ